MTNRIASTSLPSAPVREAAERRVALTQAAAAATGLDDAVLSRVVRAFYASAREDPLLAPAFDRVADWEAHVANITAFWSSVALMSGRYHGQPLAAHLPLRLEPPHFARWLELFEATLRRHCTPAGAEYLMERARRIAKSLQLGIDADRGVLPRSEPRGNVRQAAAAE